MEEEEMIITIKFADPYDNIETGFYYHMGSYYWMDNGQYKSILNDLDQRFFSSVKKSDSEAGGSISDITELVKAIKA